MIEIERKYLVKSDDFKSVFSKKSEIAQGYLSSVAERTVRIRIKGEKGFLTIKGIGNETGISRFEWEKEIAVDEAKQLLKLCEKGVIEKTRYEVNYQNHIIEIDVFHGENEGLILAEIELKDENETIEKPDWLGEEVTNDKRYYNSYISQNCFKNW
jgi:adenylate cyclase